MKRASAGGLILALAVLTGIGFAGAMIPIKACTSCDGLAQHILMRTSPSLGPVQAPRIGCPDCADRGKVSLFRSWMRPRVAPSIAALVRGLKAPNEGDSLRALQLVVQESGPDYSRFLRQYPPHIDSFRGAEFVEVEQKLYLVLLAESGVGTVPAASIGVLAILLAAEGRALDFVDVSTSAWGEYFSGRILADHAQIVIERKLDQPPADDLNYQMIRWNKGAREIRVRTSEVCRLTIRDDRLEVVEPK